MKKVDMVKEIRKLVGEIRERKIQTSNKYYIVNLNTILKHGDHALAKRSTKEDLNNLHTELLAILEEN